MWFEMQDDESLDECRSRRLMQCPVLSGAPSSKCCDSAA